MNDFDTVIDPQRFVDSVRAPLECRDTKALKGLVQKLWSLDQIVSLLDSDLTDARKLAALALGFVGDRRCIVALSVALKDRDPMVNQMAEHALWNLWFRCGSDAAQELLQQGSVLLGQKSYADAAERFTMAGMSDPTYSEAWNQRAIARYFLEDYTGALADCGIVVKLMPCHFGAWSGMGHSYAHMGQCQKAGDCYHRALAINPHLHGLQSILRELTLRGMPPRHMECGGSDSDDFLV